MAHLFILDLHIFTVDVYFFQPFGAVHEMILSDVERKSVDGGHIEYSSESLIVFVIMRSDFSDVLIQI